MKPYNLFSTIFLKIIYYIGLNIAGIQLMYNGNAIVSESHKSSDFIEFLKILEDQYPKDEKIRLILDNHSTHISNETRVFLATIPNRFCYM